jgi:hypothetical protein
MRFGKLIQIITIMISVTLFLTGCNFPGQAPESSPLPTLQPQQTNLPGATVSPLPTATATLTLTAQLQAEHRIAIRAAETGVEFYDQGTGEKFIPRGVNYAFVPVGSSYTNEILRVGTYSPRLTRQDFAHLADLGYNTVRVFLDSCSGGANCIATPDKKGLNPAYMDNIADMMLAARETGIFIQFTSNDLPDDGGYSQEANANSGEIFAGYRNSFYLRPQSISATRRYWRDILTTLQERHAAFDAVLAWQLLNEQWMFRDQPPLSLTSGMVDTTTGTYDMSDPLQKEQMVSEGLVYYIAQMKEEILLHDPTALVTMGFFVPELVAPGWYVETASLLEKSDLDFFDFHAYPGHLSLEEHAKAFGMLGYDTKPIMLGEYGAFRHIYPELDSAARVLNQWVTDSCSLGFDGWLYWSYYPSDASAGDRTWGLTDQDEYLLNLFSPVNQSDPCQPVEIPNDNIAYNKPVTASKSLADQPAPFAVDDDAATQWGAGDMPVQWIQVDLQKRYRVTEIRLLVSQWPEGNTIHRIQTRSSTADAFATVYEFIGSTSENDWLVFTPETALENVQQIRIQTISSPSWVSWKEIQVFGEVSP